MKRPGRVCFGWGYLTRPLELPPDDGVDPAGLVQRYLAIGRSSTQSRSPWTILATRAWSALDRRMREGLGQEVRLVLAVDEIQQHCLGGLLCGLGPVPPAGPLRRKSGWQRLAGLRPQLTTVLPISHPHTFPWASALVALGILPPVVGLRLQVPLLADHHLQVRDIVGDTKGAVDGGLKETKPRPL